MDSSGRKAPFVHFLWGRGDFFPNFPLDPVAKQSIRCVYFLCVAEDAASNGRVGSGVKSCCYAAVLLLFDNSVSTLQKADARVRYALGHNAFSPAGITQVVPVTILSCALGYHQSQTKLDL